MKETAMKRIIFVCGLSIILFGCNKNEKLSNVELTNNYLLFSSVENIPYSKLIKQQKIIGSDRQQYLSDDKGFIVSVDIDHVKITNDYATKKSHFSIDNQYDLDLNMELDDKQNLLHLEDLAKKIEWSSTYDDQNRIIKIERISNPSTISDIQYENGNISRIVNTYILKMDLANVYTSSEEKIFLYNDKNQLDKVIIKFFDDKESKPTETKRCSFYGYNEQGDWTKSYCLKMNENFTYFNSRKIDY